MDPLQNNVGNSSLGPDAAARGKDPAGNARQLQEILDHSPSYIAYLSKDLTYEFANRRYCEYWGKSKEEIVGRNVADIIGEARAEGGKKDYERALGGETVDFEAVSDASGTQRIIEVQYVPSIDEQRQVVGFFVFGNDVTPLRESRRRQKLILDSLPAMVFLLGKDERLLFANKFAVEVSGRTQEELIGMPTADLLSPSGYKVAKPHIDAAFQGESRVYENRVENLQGETIDIEVHLTPEIDVAGEVIGILVMSFEITRLIQATEKLRETEERFELAVRGSGAGIWELDPNRPDYLLCEHIENLLGIPIGSLKDSRSQADKRIHPDDLHRVLKFRRDRLPSDGFVIEFRARNIHDEYRWFRSAARPVVDEDGNIDRLLGAIYDIDELKKAELESAEQVRRRDQFLAMLSHELRNPLTAVTHSAFYLQTVAEQSTVAANMVDIIDRQSRQMARLLDDLLDVSRITRDKIVFDKKVFDFGDAINQVTDDLQFIFHAKQQTLKRELTTKPIPIFGDPGRLHQAITNLLDNASKYTPDGGTVTISSWIEDGRGWVAVKDTGYGILPSELENIFDLFHQQEQSSEHIASGLGVGLFLVRRIINRHDGEIRAISEGSNKGAEFRLSIPVCIDSIDVDAAVADTKFQNIKLALVEDHEDSRQLLAMSLTDRGFEVQQYADGETAITGISKDLPTIAIVDIGLPGENGMEVARAVRRRAADKNILLIALTGFGRATDRETIFEAGFDLHLVKPINVKQLCQFIAEHV